jgi:dipeptidyl aminopeptidase/acylaminoacyl peptidase
MRAAGMKSFVFLGCLVLLLSCRSTVNAAHQPAAQPKLDAQQRPTAAAFFSSPTMSHLALSPNGKLLAGILERGGVEVVFVLPLSGGGLRTLGKVERTEFHGGQSIRSLGWGGNERVLVSLESLFLAAHGVRARQTRLMVLPLDGSKAKYLGKNWPYQYFSGSQDDVISWRIPGDPEHILLNWWAPGENGISARLVNVATGAMQTVVSARLGMQQWHADHLGQVRAGSGASRHGTKIFTLVKGDSGAFEELVRFDVFGQTGFTFAAFSEKPEQIYVRSMGTAPRSALHSYDLSTRTLGPVVFEHAEVDVGPTWSSERDGHLIAVGYTTDRFHWHYLDPEMQRDQMEIDRALPHTANRIVEMDQAERLALVLSESDISAPRYSIFDRVRDELHPLPPLYPELRPEQMSPMQPIELTARDGLVLHGYLTRPRDAAPGPLPMILLPHGGPTWRDVWGWNAEVQFLASRGFAVLQVNFRGSTGYGSRHQSLGYKQWGLAMQDDLTDAVKWAIAEGIADPARVGIYGASYGGYAALMGLVKTPELFRAGASLAASSDLIERLEDLDRYPFSDFNAPMRGDLSEDREQLIATSPARRADQIRAPVLIAHGTQDPVVHEKQAHYMIDALEAAGRPVEFHIYQDEVHGFLDERNAIDFYTKLAAFFERNLAAVPRP